jgi:hypothetical protein
VQFSEPACRGEFHPRTIGQTYTFITFFLNKHSEIQNFMEVEKEFLHSFRQKSDFRPWFKIKK